MNFFSFYKTPNKSNPKVRIFSHGPRLHPHGGRMQGLVIPDLPSGELTWWKFRCGKILGEESPLGVIFLDEKKSFFSDSKMLFSTSRKNHSPPIFSRFFFGCFLEMIFINWVAWKNYKKSGLLQRLSMASGFSLQGFGHCPSLVFNSSFRKPPLVALFRTFDAPTQTVRSFHFLMSSPRHSTKLVYWIHCIDLYQIT